MSDNNEYPDWLKQVFAQGMTQGTSSAPPVSPFPPMGATAMTPEQIYLQMQALSEQSKAIEKQVAQYQTMMAQQAQIAQMQANMQAQMAQTEELEKKTNTSNPFENEPMMQHAQAMLDNAMGEEEAGVFKELLGSFGMSDKEFWKGAMVGAAAALVLSNENVRKSIMGMVGSTSDILKSGGSSVKETAENTASSVKDGVATGSEVFKDTYQAGKEGFKDSVTRHKSPTETDSEESIDTVEEKIGPVGE